MKIFKWIDIMGLTKGKRPKGFSKKERKEYYSKVAELGCIICGAEAEIHHKTGAGMGLKSLDDEVMPLCPYHHRLAPFGVCVHNGTRTFEANFGSQDELIAKTKQLLEEGDTEWAII